MIMTSGDGQGVHGRSIIRLIVTESNNKGKKELVLCGNVLLMERGMITYLIVLFLF